VSPDATERTRPSFGWRAAHLFALCGIAITQPVLDLLGGSPTFFVAHTAGPARIMFVCLLAVAVVPAVLIAIEGLLHLVWRPASWWFHLLAIGALSALFASQTLDRIPGLPGAAVLLGALALAGVVVRVYGRVEVVRSVLSALAVTPVLFAVLFVFATPAHGLLFPPDVEAAQVRLPGDPPPVFVVVFDELPLASVVTADGETIDDQRFPNLARLAGDGTWYRNATSVAGYTHEAVPAILTGDYVTGENVPPTAGGHPRNLFSLLAEDYDIASYEQLTQLCTPVLCERSQGVDGQDVPLDVLLNDLAIVSGHVSLPSSLDGWLPSVDDSWAYFGRGSVDLDQEADRLGDDRAELVDALGEQDRVGDYRAAVNQIRARRDPTLTFIHTVLPHVPWSYHANGTRYPDLGNPGLGEANDWPTEFSARLAQQRHLLQAEFADALLGELLAKLDQEGLYEDSLIVFTADHGVSFGTGTDRRTPAEETLPSIMPVPMVVKPAEGVDAGPPVDDRVAETIDLVPTIADLLEVDVPWPVDGHSLLGPPRADNERRIYARGDTHRIDDEHLALQPVVDELRDRFGTEDGGVEPYGLGPHPETIGREIGRFGAGEDDGACWAEPDGPDGVVGWVGGSLEGDDLAETEGVAVVVDGRIAGTSLTYDDGNGDPHHLYALADPSRWGDGGDVELWRFADPDRGPDLVRVPGC
jgi:hypothetical protein